VTTRHFPDWLQAFVDYASYGEERAQMYFWTGVSTIAGSLRRKVWIDQVFYTWYPNFYVILVAPPGIVSKSTTANTGMQLLKEIPSVHFGPDVVTSQALVSSFANSAEMFEFNGAMYPMSAITIASSEFGNLLNPQDFAMVNLLVDLWDGRDVFEKVTKMSGNDTIQAPWINIIACTTPSWIESNFPEYMIGGGLVSRMIFVYAEKKEKLVAYPANSVPLTHKEMKGKLVDDLKAISNLKGPFAISPAALKWGELWYATHWGNRPKGLDDDRFGGYMARKQTHLHKLAMVLTAARTDSMTIEAEDLATSNAMITALEDTLPAVFKRIGRSEQSLQAERFLAHCKKKQVLPYKEAYYFIHSHFPGFRDFEEMLKGCIHSGQLALEKRGDEPVLVWRGG
jgi:hypothetical protein